MKKRFAASAMILAMSAATVLSPLTAFAEAEEQELNIAIFQGVYTIRSSDLLLSCNLLSKC